MKLLFDKAINQLGEFSSYQLEQIASTAVLHHVPKNEMLLKGGDICESCYFLEEGAIYQYAVNSNMEELIIDLYTPRAWIMNSQSFMTRQPSQYFIKTYSSCVMYEFQIDAMHRLLELSPVFIQLGKILGEAAKRIQLLDQKLNPEEKYTYLLDHNPLLFQYFPQHMIASYLKITPETLSRIRSRKIS